MQAVILAAGRGTRLQPLTDNIPKAMLSINGKPILQILLEQLKSAGITEIIVIVNYLKEKIINHFGDGSKFEMSIKYIEQKEMKGSADAVLQAEPYIKDKFLCLACDSLFENELLHKIVNSETAGLFTCREVEDGRRFGILSTKGEKVTRIIEKPENPPTNLANFSVYVFPLQIFQACKEIPAGVKGEFQIVDAIQNLIDSGVSFGYQVSEHIIDIGTHQQLKEAEELARRLGL